MNDFEPHDFDISAAERELAEFKTMLDGTDALNEREQILPAFRRWRNLCALFGQFHGRIQVANRLCTEMGLEKFRCDLAVGRAATVNYCFIEFEGASMNGIFKRDGREVPAWSTGFERGFSQVVDWAWAHDVYKDTPPFQAKFGARRPSCVGVLVIGRDRDLANPTAVSRWQWRGTKVSVDGWPVNLLTYDDLYFYFDTDLKTKLDIAVQVSGQLAP